MTVLLIYRDQFVKSFSMFGAKKDIWCDSVSKAVTLKICFKVINLINIMRLFALNFILKHLYLSKVFVKQSTGQDILTKQDM